MVRCEFRREVAFCKLCTKVLDQETWTYVYKTKNTTPPESNFVFGICVEDTDENKMNEKALVATTSAHNLTYYDDKIANQSGKQKILNTFMPILTAHHQSKELYEHLQKRISQIRYTEATLSFKDLYKDEGFAVTESWITDVNGDEWKDFDEGMRNWFETCGGLETNNVHQVGNIGPTNRVYCWGKVVQDIPPEAVKLSNRLLITTKLKPEHFSLVLFKQDVSEEKPVTMSATTSVTLRGLKDRLELAENYDKLTWVPMAEKQPVMKI